MADSASAGRVPAERSAGVPAVPSRERARRRSPLLRSIRTRLALIFFLITLLAVAVIYVVVAPPLTSSLQGEVIRGLQQRAGDYVSPTSHLHSLGKPNDVEPKPLQARALTYARWAAKGTQLQVSVFNVAINLTGTQT